MSGLVSASKGAKTSEKAEDVSRFLLNLSEAETGNKFLGWAQQTIKVHVCSDTEYVQTLRILVVFSIT